MCSQIICCTDAPVFLYTLQVFRPSDNPNVHHAVEAWVSSHLEEGTVVSPLLIGL